MQADREKDKQVCEAQSILKWFGIFRHVLMVITSNEQWQNRRWLEGMQRRVAGCLEVSTRQNELFDLRFAVSTLL